MMRVAVLGASDKPDRYSYKAVVRLLEHGHQVFPVHPAVREIEGIPVLKSLSNLPGTVDTITVYLSPERSDSIAGDLLESGARRVIFNPGAENPDLAARLQDKGVEVAEACTLVLLATGQF
jgi:predicted CoA-binding protein